MFEGWSPAELREAQLTDSDLRCQKGQDVRPLHADVVMWSMLAKAMMAYRAIVHSATWFMPNLMLMGREVCLHVDVFVEVLGTGTNVTHPME